MSLYNTLHKYKWSHQIGRNIFSEKHFMFRVLYRFFKHIKWKKSISINGKIFTISLYKGLGLMNFIEDHEPWLDIALKDLLQPGATVLDVGANVGQTLLKLKAINPSCEYFGVEPNPYCIEYLNHLIDLNSIQRVKILEYSLGDKSGELNLQLRFDDDINATTTDNFRKLTKYAKQIKVPEITGDSLIEKIELKELSLIKLDIEGGEFFALKGLRESINKFQPHIICEIAPLTSKVASVQEFRTNNAQLLLDLMFQLGYSCKNLQSQEAVRSIEDLSNSLEHFNYLFSPSHYKTLAK